MSGGRDIPRDRWGPGRGRRVGWWPARGAGGLDIPRDRWGPGRGRLVVSSQDRVPVVGMAKVVGGAGAVGPVAARRIPTAVADPPQIPQEPGHYGRNTMQEHKNRPVSRYHPKAIHRGPGHMAEPALVQQSK